MKKAYTANQNGVQLFFTCGRITNQRCKGLCEPIRIVHRLHSNNFSDLAAFFSGGACKFFLRRRRKALDLCRLVAAQTSLYGIKKTRTHRANHREMPHCSKKNLVSRNELRETENIGATDLDELIANFLLQVREFLFFICVKKTVAMKILVLRVINSSRHRNCFVRGYVHELFV